MSACTDTLRALKLRAMAICSIIGKNRGGIVGHDAQRKVITDIARHLGIELPMPATPITLTLTAPDRNILLRGEYDPPRRWYRPGHRTVKGKRKRGNNKDWWLRH